MNYPPITLAELAARVPGATISGDPGASVVGLTHDSREIPKGALFVCLKGATYNGHRYAAGAIESGATAIAVTHNEMHSVGPIPPDVPILITPDTRAALPRLACAFYRDPSHQMTMVGVTGTNGKTTTMRMLAAILRAAGLKVGTIGTLGAEFEGAPLPSEHTTPESDQLQKLLADMRNMGAQAVVMEVSSHALAQGRTDGIAYNAGIFTNITQDHLDYHGDMESYFEAKARLFAEYPILYPRPDRRPFEAIINVASWPGRDLVTRARGGILTFTTGTMPANLAAENCELRPESARFDARFDSGVERFTLPISLPVGGAFQVGNALAAIGAALRLEVAHEHIIEGLRSLAPVPGRFEAVPAPGTGFSVIVDYAHTPDGLENLIRSAHELKPKRILTAFGCGGDRDRTKRPIMGHLAGSLADIAVVTSDNPRNEPPEAIIEQILAGMNPESVSDVKAEIYVEPDRRKAIHHIISLACPGDIVLIAGKGHEDYQIIGSERLHFDDREVAREALASLPGASASAGESDAAEQGGAR